MTGSAHFRFLNLSKVQSAELSAAIPTAEIDVHYETKMYVGSIELSDKKVVVEIDEFRRANSIVATDCDIFVSIASSKRDEIWRAPKMVNHAVNIINCPIVFSYTC